MLGIVMKIGEEVSKMKYIGGLTENHSIIKAKCVSKKV